MCNRFAPAAMNVFCFGLSHRTAGVDIRERFAIAECDLPGVVGSVGALPGIAESVIISTCNRVEFYAAAHAADLGGEAEPFERWEQRLGDTDILISSTAAPHAVVTREQVAPVMHSRPERPLFVIDLAVPRDVEPGVNDLEGAFVYDIDSLQAIARQGIETRRREIAVCEAMIERHVSEFVRWLGGGNPARPV